MLHRTYNLTVKKTLSQNNENKTVGLVSLTWNKSGLQAKNKKTF